MPAYTHEVTVTWGESDPFGLVYYPNILAWFNDAEHELYQQIGHPVDQMIRDDRAAFVMGDVHFRFMGPAACGDRVACTLQLKEIRSRTLLWSCRAAHAQTGRAIAEGESTRIYARLSEGGSLTSIEIPDGLRAAISRLLP